MDHAGVCVCVCVCVCVFAFVSVSVSVCVCLSVSVFVLCLFLTRIGDCRSLISLLGAATPVISRDSEHGKVVNERPETLELRTCRYMPLVEHIF